MVTLGIRQVLVVAVCALAIVHAVEAGKYQNKQNGVTFGSEEWSPLYTYDTPESDAQLQRHVANGGNWVRILVTWFQDTVNTTLIYPIEKPSLLASATDDEITHAINQAHSLGLKVMVSPIVDPNWSISTNHRSGPDQTWRGLVGLNFSSSDWDTWFDQYNTYVVRYATLAEKLGVEQFCVGAELNNPFLQEQHMRNTVSMIRSVFSGSLTVATLWIQVGNLPMLMQGPGVQAGDMNKDYRTSNKRVTGWPEIQWYDAIDIIGVDGYFELNVSAVTASVDELVQAWQPIIAELQVLHTTWNKTVMFTEIGYTSSYQTHLHPAHMDLVAFDDCSVWTLCVDLIEQANCYEALFQALYPLDWFGGVHFWLLRTDPLDGGTCDSGFGFVNKPSEAVIQQYFHA